MWFLRTFFWVSFHLAVWGCRLIYWFVRFLIFLAPYAVLATIVIVKWAILLVGWMIVGTIALMGAIGRANDRRAERVRT